MLRRRPRKLPKLPEPPEGKMYGFGNDDDMINIIELEKLFAEEYKFFDILSPKQRREEWGDDYFDGEINRRKKARV